MSLQKVLHSTGVLLSLVFGTARPFHLGAVFLSACWQGAIAVEALSLRKRQFLRGNKIGNWPGGRERRPGAFP